MRVAKRRAHRGPGVRNVKSKQPAELIRHLMRARLNMPQKLLIAAVTAMTMFLLLAVGV